MKKLFLSHHSAFASELQLLARELRFRGVEPWLDKDGGFLLADSSPDTARRVLAEDCLGLLLYATPSVFERPFVRDHEVLPAVEIRRANPDFQLIAVPRHLDFDALKTRSLAAYGLDFSEFHTTILEGDGSRFLQQIRTLSSGLSQKVLGLAMPHAETELRIQLTTREVGPAQDCHLHINGMAAYSPSPSRRLFAGFVSGMRDVKAHVARQMARPRIRIDGFKHLSAAFAFGRVFQPFVLSIRQTPDEYWCSVEQPDSSLQLLSDFRAADSDILAVELSSLNKVLTPDVDRALPHDHFSRLILRSANPDRLNNAGCTAFAQLAYREVERRVIARRIRSIHIFAAAPQALMMMLGQRFAGMPPTYVYDFDGARYGPAFPVPAGVL